MVTVTVEWTGPAGAYDVPVPRPVPTTALDFHTLGSESDQDGTRNRGRFQWRVTAREPGTFEIPALLPVVVYPADSPMPLTLYTSMTPVVQVHARPSAGRRAAAVAGGILGAGALAGGTTLLIRRRSAHRSALAADEALSAVAAHHAAELNAAVRVRTEGDNPAYLAALLRLARTAEADPTVIEELANLSERIAFGSYQPTHQELDRVASLVQRVLVARHPTL